MPTEPKLQDKIEKFNALYTEINNMEYYINEHNTRLTNIYNNIITAINNSFNDDASYDLYNITVNLLEIDFNLIKFIFYYIDQAIFNNFILTHIKIKNYIYDKINTFSMYYEDYIDWYNKLLGVNQIDSDTNTHLKKMTFQTTYNRIMEELFVTT